MAWLWGELDLCRNIRVRCLYYHHQHFHSHYLAAHAYLAQGVRRPCELMPALLLRRVARHAVAVEYRPHGFNFIAARMSCSMAPRDHGLCFARAMSFSSIMACVLPIALGFSALSARFWRVIAYSEAVR